MSDERGQDFSDIKVDVNENSSKEKTGCTCCEELAACCACCACCCACLPLLGCGACYEACKKKEDPL